ncbi:hypothetical protein V8F20_011694 [Naviculisporaceae sp. PSN 640]
MPCDTSTCCLVTPSRVATPQNEPPPFLCTIEYTFSTGIRVVGARGSANDTVYWIRGDLWRSGFDVLYFGRYKEAELHQPRFHFLLLRVIYGMGYSSLAKIRDISALLLEVCFVGYTRRRDSHYRRIICRTAKSDGRIHTLLPTLALRILREVFTFVHCTMYPYYFHPAFFSRNLSHCIARVFRNCGLLPTAHHKALGLGTGNLSISQIVQ